MSLFTYAKGFNEELFIADHREFYKQVHGIDLDPTGLKFPTATAGLGWGVWTPKGITSQRAYEMGLTVFGGKCWKWTGDSLDTAIKHNNRTAEVGQYVVLTAASVEPPTDFAIGLTANDTKTQKLAGLTFTERFLLGQWYHWKSGGQHLDVQGITRCDGSRFSDGSVPSVGFSSCTGKVGVDWYGVVGPYDCIRPRQAVWV